MKPVVIDKKPAHIKMKPIEGSKFFHLKKKLNLNQLNTVCQEAKCPNINECWSSGTATIMILGDVCTRFCKFCNIKTGNPNGIVDQNEPERVAQEIVNSSIKYVVITCVDRDDLEDGGAEIFARTISLIKEKSETKVESLVSDYQGKYSSLKKILDSGVDVLAHNIETVRNLTPMVRDRRASYDNSLKVLRMAAENSSVVTKSSIMLGLGETKKEVIESLEDLRENEVKIVTLGQYLRPSRKHLSVKKYYSKEEFDFFAEVAKEIGFVYVASGPMVRSSYRAAELFTLGYLKGEGG